MTTIAILLLFSAGALAQQSCPIRLTNFNPVEGPQGTDVYIQWQNDSDKRTTGVSFRAYYISMGEKRDMAPTFEYNGPPKGSYAYKHPFNKTQHT
jgi:hypothetical protein